MMFPFCLLRRTLRANKLGARHDYEFDPATESDSMWHSIYRCRVCGRIVKVLTDETPDFLSPSELFGCPGPDSLLSRLEKAEDAWRRWARKAEDLEAEVDRCCGEIVEVTGRLMTAEAERDRLRERVRVLEETLERYSL